MSDRVRNPSYTKRETKIIGTQAGCGRKHLIPSLQWDTTDSLACGRRRSPNLDPRNRPSACPDVPERLIIPRPENWACRGEPFMAGTAPRVVLSFLLLGFVLLRPVVAVPPPRVLEEVQIGLRTVDAAPPTDGRAEASAFTSDKVALLSQVPNSAFVSGSSGANEVWGYVSPAGREYGILGMRRGTGFVDITDPVNPVIVADIPGFVDTIWRDMAIYNGYTYIVTDGSGVGMQIVDVNDIDNGNATLVGTMTQFGFNTAHNIATNEESGFAYAVGGNLASGGIVAIDLADPVNPQVVGSWNGSYVHDIFVKTYHEGPDAGKEIAFAFAGSSGLKIVDVTNKSNMFTISTFQYPNRTYCHQGWIGDRPNLLFIDDELDELQNPAVSTTTTYVINITDLSNPSFMTSFTNGLAATDHNLMLRGNFVFEANYSSGLRIYDVTDPQSAVEVGYFDSYAPSNGAGFPGAWGVFTDFPSGVVVMSDQSSGLLVLDPSEAISTVGATTPTVSTWGLIALALLILTAGTVVYHGFGRGHAAAAGGL